MIDTSMYGMPPTADTFHEMPYRRLGRSGLAVSAVGLGTWKFGYPETGDNSRVNEETAMEILDRAWELGVTFWDTANRYNESSGNSERVLGRWFEENPEKRRDIVLATKIAGLMDGRTPNHWGNSRQNIMDAVYACQERLGLDTIDLLYFHRFDGMTDPEESLCAIEDLIRMDAVRYFAVSNFTVETLKAYAAASPSVRTRICAVQNAFNIIDGEKQAHAGVLEYCAKTKTSFVAWSPLGQGLLTGRYTDAAKVGAGDRLFDQKDSHYREKDVAGKLAALAEVAKEQNLTMAQLTLAYMLTIPGMGPVIPAASKVAQLEDNAKAAAVTLSEETKAKIKAITAR